MLICIHMLKNFAPTNLNRDDSNTPKTCVFGGVQRGRISSQCLKRSWRTSSVFEEEVGGNLLGKRTRKLPELVADYLRENKINEDFIKSASRKLTGFGNKERKENKDGDFTAQMILYSPSDIAAIGEMLIELIHKCSDIKEFEKLTAKELQASLKESSSRPITLDIALLGRMVTSDAFADVEASMQVAHAISTNKITMETDFFVAMDDLISGSGNDDLGAGMMGDIDYNSNCYYIYASLDLEELRANLKNTPDSEKIVRAAIPALLNAMAFSNPSGKQNSFAGHSLPCAVCVECKDRKIPVSYANAFVKPVSADKNGDLVFNSIQKLADEVDSIKNDFGDLSRERFWFCKSGYDVKPDCVDKRSAGFPELIGDVTKCCFEQAEV